MRSSWREWHHCLGRKQLYCLALLNGFLGAVAQATTALAENDAAFLHSASVTAFCQATRDWLNLSDTNVTDQKLDAFSRQISTKLNWRLEQKSYLEQHFGLDISLDFSQNPKSQIKSRIIISDNRLRMLQLTHTNDQRPADFYAVSPNCDILEARHIHYDQNGLAEKIIIAPTGRPTSTRALNPPPAAQPPAHLDFKTAPIIGHIDSGIDYRRADFAAHLVYTDTQKFLGRDFWDDDHLPFDTDTGRNPFFPQSHGSYVLDILQNTGAAFRVLPVRYPRPDMTLMGEAIDWLAENGARLVMMPLGSLDKSDWTAFFDAAQRHPELLFVISAGNNGRDLSVTPVYPAVNNLPNALTVTSVFSDGQIPVDSNFGSAVDIGVMAENLTATGIKAQKRQMSGSSFAVPKLAGYALCLAAKDTRGKHFDGRQWAQHIKESLPPADPEIFGYDVFMPDAVWKHACAPL